MMNRRQALIATAASAAALATARAWSQDGPMRLVVGLAPGGTLDLVGRTLAEKLQVSLNRNVVVENKLGAGQRMALIEARRSPPDGRTLYVGTIGPLTVFPHIYDNLGYDPDKDFTPIARLMHFDNGIATGPATGASDMKGVAAWLKANPKLAAFGTPGAGTLPHFQGIALGQAIGVDMAHVPYKGSTPALTDLVGGRLPMLITSLYDTIQMHKTGKIKLVAVHGDQRSPLVPEVPTVRETGLPMTGVSNTVVLYGPAGIPDKVVRELHAAVAKAMAEPDVQQRFAAYGMMPAMSTPEELRADQERQFALLGPLVKASGYKGE